MNFYQSDLWHSISQDIYRKPIFTFSFNSTSYRGITKLQTKLGKTLRWSMAHGLRREENHTLVEVEPKNELITQTLAHIQRDFHK